MAKNPAYHSKKKHIDVQYHFVRDMIEYKKVLLLKVETLKNTADPSPLYIRSFGHLCVFEYVVFHLSFICLIVFFGGVLYAWFAG